MIDFYRKTKLIKYQIILVIFILNNSYLTQINYINPSHGQELTKNSNTLILADEIKYDKETEIISATGNVEIEKDDRILLAQNVSYNQKENTIIAKGGVTLLDPNGSVIFADTAEITGDLKSGFASKIKILLADNSKMAANTIKRSEGNFNELKYAVYSACDLNCEGKPIWQVKARKVIHDQQKQMMTYSDAWIELLGFPVFYSPYLAHPDPISERKSGLLAPSIGGGDNLGFLYAQPYYWNLSPSKDATLTPIYTSSAGRGATVEYRELYQKGELNIFSSIVAGDGANKKDFRGHIKAKARWNINTNWRTGANIHLASDDTYLRRYDLEAPTWLTTNAFLERFGDQSYLSINAYHFQNQRRAVALGSTPLIAPLINYSFVGKPVKGGGYFTANANALALYRKNGRDQTRVSTEIGWHVPHVSSYGNVYSLRATLRSDGYYLRDVTNENINQNFTGFKGRVFPEISLEWRLPLLKLSKKRSYNLEPIIQGIISPEGKNSELIPNEDSRDFEFDYSNLFMQKRLSGYDRVEGGKRINYGGRWSVYGENGNFLELLLGQSYRFTKEKIFTEESGLGEKFSDYVGYIKYNLNEYLDLSYRFRLKKSNLSPQRSEIAASGGTKIFQLGANYIFIKQSDPLTPEFGDRKELYAYFDTRLTKAWRLSGTHREDLSPGGGSIRTSMGITYEDECFIFGIDIAEDNTEDRDFQSGFSVMLRFTLKTIGEVRLSSSVGVGQ